VPGKSRIPRNRSRRPIGADWTPVKMPSGTNGANNEGSCTLFNSTTEGSRQPAVPPTVLAANTQGEDQKIPALPTAKRL
jgi:hypothetical protein